MSAFEVSGVTVISLWAEDVLAAAHFYRDVLGLQPALEDHPDHGGRPHFLLPDGAYLVILKGQPRPAAHAHPDHFPLFALSVSDLDSAVERLQAHGIALPRGVEGRNLSRWVMFHDPAGNLIELVEQH